MISVLVPVYQCIVINLVADLRMQLTSSDIPFEILLIDDSSEDSFRTANRSLLKDDNVRYIELEKNVGRSSIRNLLANEARYDLLLFLDCDVSLPDKQFIERYLNFASKKHVTVGGIKYREERPSDPARFFRWKYGHMREAVSVEVRRKKPYASFKTANFCISRALFLKTRFSESIIGYGHEDTLFGFELARLRVPIVHIENPVYHEGLEPVEEFITKSENAVVNLLHLYRSKSPRVNYKNIALLSTFERVKRFHLVALVAAFYKTIRGLLIKNIRGSHPSIIIFSIYKLGYFCQLYQKNPRTIL